MRSNQRVLLAAALLLSATSFAQNIGINADGASPHASALLDIDAGAVLGTKKGLLIPRVTAAEMNGIVSPATSLLVFNTTANNFFYFNGTAWVVLSAGAGWGLTGNAGTNPATNFVGTTDAQALQFRVNNQHAGLISASGTGSVSFGLSAGAVNTGTQNTFLGASSGSSNTSGNANTMVGRSAGANNITGSQNVYIGQGAGATATAASGSVLIGSNTGNVTTGGSNTFVGGITGSANTTGALGVFVGSSAGNANTTGNENTAIGALANFGSGALTNATAIGARSRVDNNNSMVLGAVTGMTGGITPNVGIGTTAPADRLHVVGGIRMVDGNQAIGRIPVSDVNGRMTWTDPLAVANNLAWTLTGNAGTNPATNFMGTTNAQDFRIRTNNVERMSVTSGGLVGIGTNAPAEDLHVVGNIRMVDGNQANGRVLTSDANGTATWQTLPAGSNDWGTLGNAGTNAATDFIGTTDAQPLRFRVANINAGQIPFNNLSTLAIGVGSGIAGTGPFNVFVGDNTATAHTTGTSNTAVGSGAATSLTTGSANVMLGGAAGLMTNASSNTLLGFAAGQNNTTGGSNAFVGRSAGLTNISGSGNTVVGTNADVATGALSNATAIGQSAEVATSNSMVLGSINGVNGATASVNVGIGTAAPADRLHVVGNIRMVDGNQAAGHVLTSDANGTATWQDASASTWGLVGNAGTNPATNFIGTTDNQVLQFRVNNTFAGSIGTAVNDLLSYGFNAGPVNSGVRNTFIGNQAGAMNTTGGDNTMLGSGAGSANTTGVGNTLIGASAGTALNSSANTMVGVAAGIATTTGGSNTFVGTSTGVDNVTGSSNAFFGSNAGVNSTASNNTFLGAAAGFNTSSGGGNVFVGQQAGDANITGSGLTLVGQGADVIGTVANAGAIGQNAAVSASNSMVLGSINGVNGATASTNVGVGTTAPLTSMDIAGGLTIRRPANIPLVAGANNITVGNNSYLRLSSATGVAATTVTLSDGLVTGQMLIIEGTGILGNGFTIADNNNTNLGSDAAMNIQDSLTLIWNGSDWLEIARSTN